MGSLFDGAGTFPFAGIQCGVRPVWASEIATFPIAVTSKRIPSMKHLGDITKIDGTQIEPVDIIITTSPCQDMSVAGKRQGIEGERSNLFFESTRIIKEMRDKTNGQYPRFAVWENVPGAFSSNKGEDFRSVLEEFCKIKADNAVVPQPPKRDGRPRWNDAGVIMGNDFSVAWRVFDAQFWGVPQRRRRIFVVADFGGGCAPQILFEREGLSRHFAESFQSWEGYAGAAGVSLESADRGNGECSNTVNDTFALNVHVWDARGYGDGLVAPTVTGDHNRRVTTTPAFSSSQTNKQTNKPFLFCLDRASFNQGMNAKYDMGIDAKGVAHTLVARGPGAVAYGVPLGFRPENTRLYEDVAPTVCNGTNPGHHQGVLLEPEQIVRRFTPTECAKLQGMPSWWCADVPHADSAEYELWGNGLALPIALYIMEGITAVVNAEDGNNT